MAYPIRLARDPGSLTHDGASLYLGDTIPRMNETWRERYQRPIPGFVFGIPTYPRHIGRFCYLVYAPEVNPVSHSVDNHHIGCTVK